MVMEPLMKGSFMVLREEDDEAVIELNALGLHGMEVMQRRHRDLLPRLGGLSVQHGGGDDCGDEESAEGIFSLWHLLRLPGQVAAWSG